MPIQDYANADLTGQDCPNFPGVSDNGGFGDFNLFTGPIPVANHVGRPAFTEAECAAIDHTSRRHHHDQPPHWTSTPTEPAAYGGTINDPNSPAHCFSTWGGRLHVQHGLLLDGRVRAGRGPGLHLRSCPRTRCR